MGPTSTNRSCEPDRLSAMGDQSGAGLRPVETLVHACPGVPAVPLGGRKVLCENMCEGTGQVILVVLENITQSLTDITHPWDTNRHGVDCQLSVMAVCPSVVAVYIFRLVYYTKAINGDTNKPFFVSPSTRRGETATLCWPKHTCASGSCPKGSNGPGAAALYIEG